MQAPPISRTTAFVGGTALVGAVIAFSMARGKGVGTRIGAALSGGLTALFTGQIIAGAIHGVREMSQEFQENGQGGTVITDEFGRPRMPWEQSSLPHAPAQSHDPRPKELIEVEKMPRGRVTNADMQAGVEAAEDIIKSVSHRRMTPESPKAKDEDLDFKFAVDPNVDFQKLLELQRKARAEGRSGGKTPSKS